MINLQHQSTQSLPAQAVRHQQLPPHLWPLIQTSNIGQTVVTSSRAEFGPSSVNYITTRTNSALPGAHIPPCDTVWIEALIVAPGHKCHGWDLNPHPDDWATRIQCTWWLGHNNFNNCYRKIQPDKNLMVKNTVTWNVAIFDQIKSESDFISLALQGFFEKMLEELFPDWL